MWLAVAVCLLRRTLAGRQTHQPPYTEEHGSTTSGKQRTETLMISNRARVGLITVVEEDMVPSFLILSFFQKKSLWLWAICLNGIHHSSKYSLEKKVPSLEPTVVFNAFHHVGQLLPLHHLIQEQTPELPTRLSFTAISPVSNPCSHLCGMVACYSPQWTHLRGETARQAELVDEFGGHRPVRLCYVVRLLVPHSQFDLRQKTTTSWHP